MDFLKLSLIWGILGGCHGAVTFMCDFEIDLCGMTQVTSDDGDDWLRGTDTPSAETGPSADHTTGTGYFAFVEATPQDPDTITELALPTQSGEYCLRFYYHLYGQHIGRLEVVQEQGGMVLWSMEKDQSRDEGLDMWLDAQVSVAAGLGTAVFRAVKGGTGDGQPFGDIAIDDVTIEDTLCEGSVSPSTMSSSSTSTSTTSRPTTNDSPSTSTTTRPTTTGSQSTSTTTRPTTTGFLITKAPTQSSTSSAMASTSITTRTPLMNQTVSLSTTMPLENETDVDVSTTPSPPTPSPSSTYHSTDVGTFSTRQTTTMLAKPGSAGKQVLMCEDFERARIPCDMIQSDIDQFDWEQTLTQDTSRSLGPTADSVQNEEGAILYIQTNRYLANDVAVMSIIINLREYTSATVSVYFFINGNNPGSMYFETISPQGIFVTHLLANESFGNQWNEWEMTVEGPVHQVNFKAVIGPSPSRATMALDRIRINHGIYEPRPTAAPSKRKAEDTVYGMNAEEWLSIVIVLAFLLFLFAFLTIRLTCEYNRVKPKKKTQSTLIRQYDTVDTNGSALGANGSALGANGSALGTSEKHHADEQPMGYIDEYEDGSSDRDPEM